MPEFVTSEAKLKRLRPAGRPAVIRRSSTSPIIIAASSVSPFVVLARRARKGWIAPRAIRAASSAWSTTGPSCCPSARQQPYGRCNIVRDPASRSQLIPVGRTLRINGRAASASTASSESFTEGSRAASSWSRRKRSPVPRWFVPVCGTRRPCDESSLPSNGAIMKSLLQESCGDSYDRDATRSGSRETIY